MATSGLYSNPERVIARLNDTLGPYQTACHDLINELATGYPDNQVDLIRDRLVRVTNRIFQSTKDVEGLTTELRAAKKTDSDT